jgi:hypothetical protein
LVQGVKPGERVPLNNELAKACFGLEPVPKKRNIDVSSHEATIADAMKRLAEIQAKIEAAEKCSPAPCPPGGASASHASGAKPLEPPQTEGQTHFPDDVDDALRAAAEREDQALQLLTSAAVVEA